MPQATTIAILGEVKGEDVDRGGPDNGKIKRTHPVPKPTFSTSKVQVRAAVSKRKEREIESRPQKKSSPKHADKSIPLCLAPEPFVYLGKGLHLGGSHSVRSVDVDAPGVRLLRCRAPEPRVTALLRVLRYNRANGRVHIHGLRRRERERERERESERGS